MLVLFDIDGTLISTGGVGRSSLDRAFEDEFGVRGAMEGVRLHGNTDPMILQEAFTRHLGRGPVPEEADRIMTRYLAYLQEALAVADAYQILPGVEDLLDALRRHGNFVVGLATGNTEDGARLKLQRGGLWSYFSFGGYGSDAAERRVLVERGIERGQQKAETQLGRRLHREEIVVVGDTERDVEAARGAGVKAVGVRFGSGSVDALEASKPDLVVDALDSQPLRAFLRL